MNLKVTVESILEWQRCLQWGQGKRPGGLGTLVLIVSYFTQQGTPSSLIMCALFKLLEGYSSIGNVELIQSLRCFNGLPAFSFPQRVLHSEVALRFCHYLSG